MYPTLFGFLDSYSVMMIVGVAAAIVLCGWYFKKQGYKTGLILDIAVCACGAVISGIIFSILFENLYEFCEDPENYKFTFAMTFYGGLFGGVLGFLLVYFLYFRKHNEGIMLPMLTIAPACITFAHGFGRIGCFLSGCCYGKETDRWFGIKFPDLPNKVIPTQLFEAIFLFILTLALIIVIIKTKMRYMFTIYMVCYAIFRFIIEFYRGDYRGAYLGIFSPSQVWCIVILIGGIAMLFIEKYIIFPRCEKHE